MANKRNFWGHEETKTMLAIMVDKNYMGLTGNKIHENHELYTKIKNDLSECGFNTKNETQIKMRWKNLKHQFLNAKKYNIKCPYFQELDILLQDNNSINVNNNVISYTTKGAFKAANDNTYPAIKLPAISQASKINLKSSEIPATPKINFQKCTRIMPTSNLILKSSAIQPTSITNLKKPSDILQTSKFNFKSPGIRPTSKINFIRPVSEIKFKSPNIRPIIKPPEIQPKSNKVIVKASDISTEIMPSNKIYISFPTLDLQKKVKTNDSVRTKRTFGDTNQNYFETHKFLIDHEMKECSQKQAKLDERFNVFIQKTLTENTSIFLDGLKNIFSKN